MSHQKGDRTQGIKANLWIRGRLRIAIVGGAFVLAGCGSAVAAQAPTADVGPVVETKADLATDFELTVYQGAAELGGEKAQFSEVLAQGKPVVLNFWAGLCPPCRVEMPDLQSVYEEYKDRVLLVGLDVGPFTGLGSRDDGRQLLEALSITYPAGTTFEPEVLTDYRVIGMPSTYFITPEGEIVDSWAGLLTRDKLVELVETLLAASG